MGMTTILEQWAGHFQATGSDKVWGAAYTDDGQVMSVWGRRGSALQRGTKPFADQQAASRAFSAKVRKKQQEGYRPVPFDDARYGVPTFGPSAPGGTTTPLVLDEGGSVLQDAPVYQVSYVTPLDREQVYACTQQGGAYGVTEKINGERCVVAFDGQETLTAYNRKGIA